MSLFSKLQRSSVDPEVLMALRYKLPESLSVSIHKEPTEMYVARIHNPKYFQRPIVTQGKTGQELFEMVNDAVYTMLDIPAEYRDYMTAFAPPEDIRQELSIQIPDEYLDKELGLVKV